MKNILKLIAVVYISIIGANSYAATSTISACQEDICKDYFKQYKKYARLGYADAMATLGDLYYFGHGTERNIKKALKQYKSSAKYGSVKGQFKTAMIYLNHDEFKDLDDGIKYLKKSARNGHDTASLLLGIIYFSTDFHEQSLKEADKWLAVAYNKKNKKVPAFIEHIKSTNKFNASNFPNLTDAIRENPIQVASTVQENTKTNKTALTESRPETEVITVYGTLTDLFDAQLASLKNTYPEKGAQNTGSKIIGKTCAQTIACGTVSDEDFNRGVRSIMGDHAVVMFRQDI